MGNTVLRRVGAVENAFCAFSKDLVGAFWASTGPAASTRGVSAVRMTHRRQGANPFVETSQTYCPEVQQPQAIVDFFKRHVLPAEHLGQVESTAAPRRLAKRRDAAHLHVPRVLDRRH